MTTIINNLSKMNPEFKQPWIDALRSGKYEQGRNALCKDNKFCCLGVLCEINIEKLNIKVEVDQHLEKSYDMDRTALPRKVSDEINIDNTAVLALIDMNDIKNKSFEEIADWIEENL